MRKTDPRLQRAADACEAGRHDEALAALLEVFAELDGPGASAGISVFFTMFMWSRLAPDYAPARDALAALRDEQVRKLLAGDERFGVDAEGDSGYAHMRERFAIVVDMNEILGDPASTRAMFIELERQDPVRAARRSWQVMKALVDTGDFARADRYRGDPLRLLDGVNLDARTLHLFPPAGGAPRLAADMMNLTNDVRIGMAVLRGLGRADEAEALRTALLDGLESPELRALAERELHAPGTINREITAHRIAYETSRPK
ncbi:hypothetical protein [Massilia sp. TN1-12]|uniref:hypothetical protein n=1 Tax=Massilia paldalensis TaxID=3377675 RepID=UPI00384CA9F7